MTDGTTSSDTTTDAFATSTTGAATTPRRWWRTVPAVVWAITGLHVALMAMCTFLYPPFTGYDETWHVDMTRSYYQGNGPYAPGGRHLDRGVEVAVTTVPVPTSLPPTPYSQTTYPARGSRRSFTQLDDGRPASYPVPNQMVQHPPLYYLTEAGLLHLVPGGGDLPYDLQVWVLRMFSLLMMAPVPLLCWAAARRLVGEGPHAVVAALLPVTLPGLSRLGGSVNNDDLMILLGSALIYVLARVVTGDLRRRTGLVVGVLTTLALSTKGFGLVFPLAVAVAYGLAWLRFGRRPWAPVGIATAVVAAVGSVWWVRNLVLYGAIQPSGLGPVWTRRIRGAPHPGGSLVDFLHGFVTRLVARLWGGFGLPDRPHLPTWVVDGWFCLVVAGAVIGIAYGTSRREPPEHREPTGQPEQRPPGAGWKRATAALFTLPAASILGIVLVGALGSYRYNQAYGGVQGRYLLPGLAGVAVLAGRGWCRMAGRAGRLVPLLVTVAGLLTQAYAWTLLVLGWWSPRSGVHGITRLREGMSGVLRWSPLPEAITVVPFVLVVLLSLLVLATVVRAAVQPSAGERLPGPGSPQGARAPSPTV